MSNNSVFISHSDITADKIYCINSEDKPEVMSIIGGGCNWNVLYHLGYMGKKCFAFGSARR